MNSGALHQTYLYAGISVGSDIANSRIFPYALQGTRIRPEAACKISLVRDSSNNAMITWNPRNRINYEWLDGIEQGSDEAVEGYEVDILGIGGVVRTIDTWQIGEMTVGDTPNADAGVRMASYTAAMQNADGLVGAGEVWNPSDEVNTTIAGVGLTASNLSSGNAAVRALTSATAGLFYFEANSLYLLNNGTSIGVSSASYNLSTLAPSGDFKGVNAITGLATAQIAGFAFNLNTGLYWTRQNPTYPWNGNPSDDPATGAGGISLGALVGVAVFPTFVSFSTGEMMTANFGGSPFAGVVPAGYAYGWPGPQAPRISATIYEMSNRIGRGFPATITG